MTIADKRYLLASIAVKFTRHSGGRYEVDELINEAWLSRHVRDAKEVPLLWQAGRWAMITYMHQQQRDTPNHWYRCTFTSLYREPGAKCVYTIEPECTEIPWRLDTLDALEYMARNLSDREREIMALRFSGSQLKEIGAVIGISRERVRQIVEAVKAKMRIQYEISMAG